MFSHVAYNLDLVILGVSIASSIILGSIIFFKDRRSATGLLFLLLTIVTSAWSFLNYLCYKVFDPFWSLWLVRLVMFLAVYQAFFFFALVKTIPNRKIGISLKWRRILYPWVALVSVLTLTPFLFSGVEITQGEPPSPVPAPGMALFALTAIPLVLFGFFRLVKGTRDPDRKRRSQFKILMIGVVLMFLAIIVFNFIFVTILGNSAFIPLSALFTLPFVFATFWAIAKHRLLNVKIIGTEILVFFLVMITFLDVVFSDRVDEIIFRIAVFIISLIFSIFLIKSVVNEVKQRVKLEELTEKLRLLDDQKDEFISMAAHELRSPMTAIKGYISMVLEGDTGEIPQKTREFLADANSTNERLIRLVNNMLNVARIEEGRLLYQLEKQNLSQTVRRVFNQFVHDAARKGLEFNLEIPRDLKDEGLFDADKLVEVMGNFISNATKYTETGKVTVRLVGGKSGRLRFEVEDTGPGITEEEIKKLFHKFYRADSNAGKTTGTGLGLYISKIIVERFGGEIGVSSESGKGSTFWFELPRDPKLEETGKISLKG